MRMRMKKTKTIEAGTFALSTKLKKWAATLMKSQPTLLFVDLGSNSNGYHMSRATMMA
jgi:hypothetical protein